MICGFEWYTPHQKMHSSDGLTHTGERSVGGTPKLVASYFVHIMKLFFSQALDGMSQMSVFPPPAFISLQ